MITTTLVILFFVLFFIYYKKKLNYWNVRNVPNLNPITPFGDLINCIIYRKNVFDLFKDFYDNFKAKGCKFAGFYFTLGPTIIPIDYELIKRILATDYDYFNERGMYCDRKKIPLSDNIMTVGGERWKYLRDMFVAIMSPKNVNGMIPVTEIYAKQFSDILKENQNKEIDIFSLTQRYILDVICNCYLGLDEENLKKNRSPLIEYAHKISTCSFKNLFKIALTHGTNNPGNLFTSLMIDKDVNIFFNDYVANAYKLRKETKAYRNDALNYFIKYFEDENEDFDFQSFVGQVFILFAATFDTTAHATTYVFYELGKSEYYQNKLREEINTAINENGGELNYDIISNLEFLNRFITETLRFHPIVAAVYRQCVKDYKIPGSDVIIEKGTSVVIPVHAIHNDQEMFPNPENFDPDRFLNIKNKQYYVAFGLGQKKCPGKKFALLLMKILIVKILSDYEVSVNKKTGPKLEKEIFTKQFLWTYKTKIWLNFTPINKK